MSSDTDAWSRRDSWPPTLVHLESSSCGKEKDSEASWGHDINENPLTYFLTPASDDLSGSSAGTNGDTDNEMMDFDAGIEDPNRPREAMSSISPSSLARLQGLSSTNSWPDSEEGEPTTDEDDDDDDDDMSHMYASHARTISIDGLRSPARSSQFDRIANSLSQPAAVYFPTIQPRVQACAGFKLGATVGAPRTRRTGRLWREPSWGVWSINEEAEEKEGDGESKQGGLSEGAMMAEAEAGKSKKHVRFVLPAKD